MTASRGAILSLLSVLLIALPARAEEPADTKTMCLDAHRDAQVSRRAGRLLQAREQLVACAQQACPKIVSEKCSAWHRELEPMIPSIVVTVTDEQGDVVDVTLSIDGEIVADMLDGKPHELDPGPHALKLERPGQPAIEKKILLAQGDKQRRVEVKFDTAGGATMSDDGVGDAGDAAADDGAVDEPGTSPLVFVGFGLAGAGLVVGAVTGGLALSQKSDFDAQCPSAPCDPTLEGDFDGAVTLAHGSTIGFAVAGAGAALGVIGLVVGGSDDSGTTEVGVGPRGVVVSGSF